MYNFFMLDIDDNEYFFIFIQA